MMCRNKYHVTNNDTPKVLEITKRRKQNFDEIEIEDGEFVNTDELLRSDDDYDPQDDTMDSESEEGSGNEGYQLSIAEKRIKCPQFDSTFRWRSGLDSHLKSQHVGQYKCMECRWSFKTNEQFKEHINYLHSDYDESRRDSETDTDANESEGEDTYSEKDTAVTHSDTESISLFETKLIYKTCKKQFAQNSNLARHIQNIHSNNGHKRKSLETIEQGQTKVLKS